MLDIVVVANKINYVANKINEHNSYQIVNIKTINVYSLPHRKHTYYDRSMICR